MGPTIESIASIFGAHGDVAKVTITEGGGAVQAHVQFKAAHSAAAARAKLDGVQVPIYMTPRAGRPVTMRCAPSALLDLTVTAQSERARCARVRRRRRRRRAAHALAGRQARLGAA